jgi:hypothetical protein
VDQTIKQPHENQTPNNVLQNSSPDLRDDVRLSAEQATQPLSEASLVLGARLRSLLHLPAGAGLRAAAVIFVCLWRTSYLTGNKEMEKTDLRCLGHGHVSIMSPMFLENKHELTQERD